MHELTNLCFIHFFPIVEHTHTHTHTHTNTHRDQYVFTANLWNRVRFYSILHVAMSMYRAVYTHVHMCQHFKCTCILHATVNVLAHSAFSQSSCVGFGKDMVPMCKSAPSKHQTTIQTSNYTHRHTHTHPHFPWCSYTQTYTSLILVLHSLFHAHSKSVHFDSLYSFYNCTASVYVNVH